MDSQHEPFTGTNLRPRRRSKAARIWIGILVGVVAGNALAAGTYLAMNGVAKERGPERKEDPQLKESGAVSAAHRIAGLQAMDNGDYDGAVEAFVAALRGPEPAADLPQLLNIARRLREQARASEAKAAAVPPPVVAPPPPPPPAVKKDTTAKATKKKKRRRTRRRKDASDKPKSARTATDKSEAKRARKPADTAERGSAGDDRAESAEAPPPRSPPELPLCPEDYKPAAPSTPYAVLPRRCRPRSGQ